MPGCYQLSLDQLLPEVMEVAELEIPAVLLFGIPASKDAVGSEAYDGNGIVREAVRVIKQAVLYSSHARNGGLPLREGEAPAEPKHG